MSEELKVDLNEFDFGDGKIELDEGGGALVRWAFARLAAVNGVGFESGSELEIPQIIVDGMPYKRPGMKPGNLQTFWFELKTHRLDGTPYTLVENYHINTPFRIEDAKNSKTEHKDGAIVVDGVDGLKKKFPHIALNEKQRNQFANEGFTYISAFSNLQKPSIFANLGRKANELRQAGLWLRIEYNTFRVTEDKNGKLDNNGNVKKYYDSYWAKVTAFENEAAWKAAREADGGNSTQPASPYPTTWAITEQWPLSTYLNIAKKSLADNPNDLKEAAKAAKLLNTDYTLADTPNGGKVSVETIAEVFGKTVAEVEAAGIVDSPF